VYGDVYINFDDNNITQLPEEVFGEIFPYVEYFSVKSKMNMTINREHISKGLLKLSVD